MFQINKSNLLRHLISYPSRLDLDIPIREINLYLFTFQIKNRIYILIITIKEFDF